MKNCTCNYEARRTRRNCTLCLVASMMNSAELLLGSTRTFVLPLGASYDAIYAMNCLMQGRVALFNLLHADMRSAGQTELEIPHTPMFGMGVV